MNVLESIVAATRAELEGRKQAVPQAELARAAAARVAAGDRRPFADALRRPGVSVIAEHKRASPSAGTIRDDLTLEQVVNAYELAGATALSILTEGPSFAGELKDLETARATVNLPLLRKDFIVDSYQVHEAAAAGADAILLIVAALDDGTLGELHELATGLQLDVLVEVHDAAELDRALALGAAVIGINNRDLTTLQVDTETTFSLRSGIPDGPVVVAESGFSRADQIERLRQAGIDAVLVGEALMRSPDIEAACRALTAAGDPS